MYHLHHLIFLVFGINIVTVSCRPHLGPGNYKFCGAHLMDTLQLVCGHSGYQPPFWDISTTEKLDIANIINYQELNSAGIATECCYRGCSLQVLSSYCVDPKRKIRESDIFDLGHLASILVPMMEESGGVAPKTMAAAPEVGKLDEHKRHVGNKGRKGKKGHQGRKERKGRAQQCSCERNKRARRKRLMRARKVDVENMKRSAPLFGTVSPEYMRLPRTLDEVPEPYRGFQIGI